MINHRPIIPFLSHCCPIDTTVSQLLITQHAFLGFATVHDVSDAAWKGHVVSLAISKAV